MAKFVEKLLSGQETHSEDWNEFLVEMHRRAPSQTPHAYSAHKTKEGFNSYEILAQALDSVEVKGPLSILDLACGDGYLIPYCLKRIPRESRVYGIDMSEGELSVARANFKSPEIEFHQARAQNLPLKDDSIDAVLCHMAFMLMNPIEEVVGELKRVLKTGGVFAGVVGNPAQRSEFQDAITESLSAFQKREFPQKSSKFAAGDGRSRTRQGLESLFNPASGFTGLEELSEFKLQIVIDHVEIWDWYRDMYFVSFMPQESQMRWKEELLALGRSYKSEDGKLRFDNPMLKFIVKK